MTSASIKVQKGFVNSILDLQCPAEAAIPDLQKEHPQFTSDTQDHQNSANVVSRKENEILIIDVESPVKHDTLHATNCDQKKTENEDKVIIVENDKKELEQNIDKTEHVQNAESAFNDDDDDDDVMPLVVDSDSKINTKYNNGKESIIRIGNQSLKRKRRNFVTQETDSPLPSSTEENNSKSKRKKKNINDRFCWRCHKESVEAHCSACPRSWHRRCIGMQQSIIQNWICGECAAILKAENAETRSTAMAQLSVDQLCLLLKHVVERMREYPGSEPFWKAVETSEAPNYLDYVVKPMDLSLLESNVRAKLYGSTDAFMADAKWIQHNCIVFNTCGGVYADTSKLTNAAKQIIKLARQEVSEIEACPDCYAHGRNLPRPQPTWFIEPCRRPHPLVWAKLKGFPFWPAKAMPRLNSQGFVDVRFFGEHDRAWVSPRDLYLYSEDPPVPLPRKRKLDMEECVREITRHCRKLELVFGQFKFAPPKVQYNPHDPMQIKLMLPNYDPLRSNSNYVSSQFLIPKKKQFLKKRLNVINKTSTAVKKVPSDTQKNKDTSRDHNDVVGSKSLLANVDDDEDDDDDVDDDDDGDNSSNERTERKKIQDSSRCKKVEASAVSKDIEPMVEDGGADDDSDASISAGRLTTTKDSKQHVKNAKQHESKEHVSTSLNTTTKREGHLESNTSKIDVIDENGHEKGKGNGNKNENENSTTTTKQNSNESDAIRTPEQNNNSKKVTKDNRKGGGNLSKQLITSSLASLNKHMTDDDHHVHQTSRQESLLKTNVNKGDVGQNLSNSSKSSVKTNKNVIKVYKPKTRIVDKMNAEKALKSTEIEEKQKATTVEKIESSSEAPENNLTLTNNNNNRRNGSIHSNSSNNNSISSVVSDSPNNNNNNNQQRQKSEGSADDDTDDVDKTAISSGDQQSADALSFIANNARMPTSVVKQSNDNSLHTIEKEKCGHVMAAAAIRHQSSKNSPQTLHQEKKESKARKSFPNKTRNYPQFISQSHPYVASTNVLSNSNDSVMYNIPATVAAANRHQAENRIPEYQMVPPEAGPISARLYHDAQDLARRMARLMEEAYKEVAAAAQETLNCENVASEDHQATVHFLRLQIERMRWEHQQQLAELKHNTDRVLREMKAGLEAERLRAIEETRREAEEEKSRCIEEIKRKQWCAMCGREALFYCCWNTAYCNYPCQQSHWPMHMRTCAQKPSFTTIVTTTTTTTTTTSSTIGSSTANSNPQQQQQVMPRLMINTQHAISNIRRA